MSSGPSSSSNSARDSAPDSNSVDRDMSSLFARLEIPNSLSEEFHGNGNRGPQQPDRCNEAAPSDMPDCTKAWQRTVTKDLRNHLVGKLVKAICPEPTPEELINGNFLKDLIANARGMETEMFDSANDREEYYQLLAEKIYKIQREVQEESRLSTQGAAPHDRNMDGSMGAAS
ncbi:hypothetical protein B9Z55_011491 [Caenorhabditis nigoni]|uniref:histone acetyltransferase n=1 Tax=Caenorhabditis nigoni TaxID=1611254 RepID=A0A2G5UKF2_9PELO|nr:hypothetical protein B9Z55_011491 [Caenorhabditis nigoni]